MNEPTKRCRGCGQTLPLERYGREPHGRLGLRARCLRCHADASSVWYWRTKDRAAREQSA